MLQYWTNLAQGESIYDGNCVNCKENAKISASSAITCCHRLTNLLPQLKFNSIKVNFKIFDTILSSKFKCILAIGQLTDNCAELREQLNNLLGNDIDFNQFIAWSEEYACKLFLKHIVMEEYTSKLNNIMNDLCLWLHLHPIQKTNIYGITTRKKLELDSDSNTEHEQLIFTLNTVAKTKELTRFKTQLKEFIQNGAVDNINCNVSFFCNLLNVLRYVRTVF